MPDTAAPPAATPVESDLPSERQRLFCLLYARGGNGRAAAEGAGYSPRTARQQASRLLTYADIRETIADLRAEIEEQNGIARAELIARLDYVYLRAMTRGEYHPAIRAVEAQAKLSGLLSARLTLAEARLIARAQAELATETADAATDAAEPAPAAAAATSPEVMPGLDPRIPDASQEPPSDDSAVPAEATRGSDPRMTAEKPDPTGRLETSDRDMAETPEMAAPDRAAPSAAAATAGRAPDPEPFIPTAAQRKAAASALAWARRSSASAASTAKPAAPR